MRLFDQDENTKGKQSVDNELLKRAIEIEDNWMLNDCKKWERLDAIGVCRFCLLAIMGKLESEVDRLSSQGLNADLYDPECIGCSFRKTRVFANPPSSEHRVACLQCLRPYRSDAEAILHELPHDQRQTTKASRQHL